MLHRSFVERIWTENAELYRFEVEPLFSSPSKDRRVRRAAGFEPVLDN